jgi:hypothetical protein
MLPLLTWQQGLIRVSPGGSLLIMLKIVSPAWYTENCFGV